jgi:hypothetical protein
VTAAEHTERCRRLNLAEVLCLGECLTDLDGATTRGEPNAWPADAGQFAARFNSLTPELREAAATRIAENADIAAQVHQGLYVKRPIDRDADRYVAHDRWLDSVRGRALGPLEGFIGGWKAAFEQFGRPDVAAPDLAAEVERLSVRPSLDEVTLAARDIINDGFGPDIRISGPDAARIARAVLALFPQVDA